MKIMNAVDNCIPNNSKATLPGQSRRSRSPDEELALPLRPRVDGEVDEFQKRSQAFELDRP